VEVAGVLAAAAPLGMPSGKVGHHPGWKPLQGSAATMSQAGLQARAGSPDPLRGTCKSPSGSHRRDCNEHPLPSARKCVRGGVCGRVLGAEKAGTTRRNFATVNAVASGSTPRGPTGADRLRLHMSTPYHGSLFVAPSIHLRAHPSTRLTRPIASPSPYLVPLLQRPGNR